MRNIVDPKAALEMQRNVIAARGRKKAKGKRQKGNQPRPDI
jgi:hypothetical protein